MAQDCPLQTIAKEELTPIVRKALDNETVEVTEWQFQLLQGGTAGEVYLLEGKARADSADLPADNRNATVPWSLILKIHRQWRRSGDPECWKREKMLYQSGLFDALPDSLRVPRCFGIFERDEDEIWLWLEEAAGRTGTRMSVDEYGLAARHLAHYQGQFLVGESFPRHPWLSTRRWLVNTVANWGTGALPWLQSVRTTSQSDRFFTPDMVDATLQLWADRDGFLDVVDSLPGVVCHRDYNAGNLFIREDAGGDGQTTVIDWDCAGPGPISEDISDMVGEALVFYDFDLDQAEELKESVLSSYFAGLKESGWRGDQRLLRLSYAIHSSLQWCFRVACRARDTDDKEAKERYAEVQRFMLALANEAREGTSHS